MSKERLYSEKEIADIFERAAKELEASRSEKLRGEGLSLTELQAIGVESGIPAQYIAKAALALGNSSVQEPIKMFIGSPISVSRTLDLPRKLTEEEWDALVVDLRSTFNAKGAIEQDGSFRQWTNGNLQFLLEPMGEGSRIRMKTLKGNAKGGLVSGVFYIAVSVLMMLGMWISQSALTPLLFFAIFIMVMGLGLSVHYKRTLPEWSETRNQQMIDVGERLKQRMGLDGQEKSLPAKTPAISLDDVPAKEEQGKSASSTRLRS